MKILNRALKAHVKHEKPKFSTDSNKTVTWHCGCGQKLTRREAESLLKGTNT